jgi:hypothetical protein
VENFVDVQAMKRNKMQKKANDKDNFKILMSLLLPCPLLNFSEKAFHCITEAAWSDDENSCPYSQIILQHNAGMTVT